MHLTRREMLMACAGAGATLFLRGVPEGARASQQVPLMTRPIPSSGEPLPIIGLGSAGTFGGEGSDGEMEPLREVLRLFHARGGRFFDTAPTYGDAERVSGQLAGSLGVRDDLFFATKVSTPLAFASDALAAWSREEGARQRRGSREAWGRDMVDLEQVHNLYAVAEHLPVLREAKEAGRTRYIGVTVQAASMYADLEAVIRSEELDFIQVNYSLAEREVAERILPLAQDRALAVVVNEPFNGGTLFRAVRGRTLPEWAADYGCASWAQLFLKYIVSHPAVTVAIPATSDPGHLVDNMGAGVGVLPDEAGRRRMEALFDGL